MHSIKDNRLETLMVRGQTIKLLTKLHYLAGKQANAVGVQPDLYEELRADVLIQGTKSSNDIEGIRVDDERYRPLIQGRVEPSDRIEKLIIGYRDTLAYIHREWEAIQVSPDTIRDLHRRMNAQIPNRAGEFRETPVHIEREEGNVRAVVFVPPPPSLVNGMVDQLCQAYEKLHGKPDTDEFLLLAGFVLDFTCIHPFEDGNGRVSRLLTTLLAYKAGFEVVRYISHEKLVADSRRYYYATLTRSSENWLRGNHRWDTWIDYLASKFILAYEELVERVSAAGGEKGYQGRRIKEVIEQLPSKFSIRDIFDRIPTATRPTVNRVLSELKEAQEIETVGAGPKAHYRKVSTLDR